MSRTKEGYDKFARVLRRYRATVKEQSAIESGANTKYQKALRAALEPSRGKKAWTMPIQRVTDALGEDKVKEVRDACLAEYAATSKRQSIWDLDERLFYLAMDAELPVGGEPRTVFSATKWEFSSQTAPMFYVKAKTRIAEHVLKGHGVSCVVKEDMYDGKVTGLSLVVETTDIGAEILRRSVHCPTDMKEHLRFALKQGNRHVLGINCTTQELRDMGLDEYGNDI